MDDLRVALALMPDATMIAETQGSVLAANEAAVELFGAPHLEGQPLARVLPSGPEPGRGWQPAQARRANGTPLPVEACARAIADGRLLCCLRTLRDTALVGEAQRYFDHAFDRSPIGMALFNTDGEYVRVNPSLCVLLGRSAEDLLGRRDQELTHPDDRQADLDAAWEILEGRMDTHQTEKRFVRPDGAVVWALANLTFLRDDSGRPLSWVGQFQDVTERRRREAELRHLADHDPLTGLLNRRAFERALEQHLARVGRYGVQGAVLMIDLDGFKAVNDAHGHGTGDALLASCAERLRAPPAHQRPARPARRRRVRGAAAGRRSSRGRARRARDRRGRARPLARGRAAGDGLGRRRRPGRRRPERGCRAARGRPGDVRGQAGGPGPPRRRLNSSDG